jgi:hypothetical protein
MSAGRLAVLLAMALAAPALASCGDDDDAATTEAPRTITADDVRAVERDSPERAVLEWWRYVQFQNSEGAYALYADDADVTLDDVARQITYAASSFVGVPEIVDVEKSDGLATVYMTLQAPGSDAPPRPLSANLREEGGDWVLRDNALMDQQAARVARARAAAEDEGSGS